MDRPDPYAILGLTPDAGPDEVRRAWRDLVSRFHPDRFADASPEARAEAQAHTAVVNAAYEEIRSGRARRRRVASRPSPPPPGGFGWDPGRGEEGREARGGWQSGGWQPGGWQSGGWESGGWQSGGGESGGSQSAEAGEAGDPWIDPDLFVQGVRLIEERRLRARSGARRRAALVVVATLLGALLLHLSFSRNYGYDYVYDGQGNTYEDVDCGDGYDRGRSTAAALRAQASTSLNAAALRHQADVIEEVCGEWAELLPPLALVSIPSIGFSVWWLFLRRRPPARW